MKKLFLHVGQHKTGSSFIQSYIAKNTSLIEKHHIKYPFFTQALERAAKGYISSGNGNLLLKKNHPILLKEINRNYNDESLLFSAEHFYTSLLNPESIDTISMLRREFCLEAVSILLFVRDPIEHACSLYQQYVKREGMTISIEKFFETYNTPLSIDKFLNTFSQIDGVSFEIYNYSIIKKNIQQIIARWLNISEQSLALPSITNVNRSLTFGEIELVRYFNTLIGKTGQILADRLCHQLPDIKADNIVPSIATQESLLERLSPIIENLNARIQPSQHYRCKLLPESTGLDTPMVFSREQLLVIAEGLGSEIKKLNDRNKILETKISGSSEI